MSHETKPNRRLPAHYKYLRRELEADMELDEPVGDMVYPFAAVGTLTDYLKIRKKWSCADFPAYALIYDPFEWIMYMDTATSMGIFDRDFFRAMRGDAVAIDRVSVVLLEKMQEYETAEDKTHAIGRGRAESNANINYLAAAMNEACFQNGTLPPPSLVYLISLRLCGQNCRGRQKGSMYQLAHSVHTALNEFMNQGAIDNPTMRGLAKAAGVAPSTISRRWDEIIRAMNLWAIAEVPPEEWLEPKIPQSPDFQSRHW